MLKRAALALTAVTVLALTGCSDGDPCDAQPNPDKQSICKGDR